jgi:hypothetical protein
MSQVFAEDPQPELDEIQQREIVHPAVPVKHVGPITTHELPARVATIFDFGLTTTWQNVLAEDPKRKRTILICDQDWVVSHAGRGGGTWFAKVPLVLQNVSAVYAKVGSSTATLTVIPEEWGD